MVTDVYGVSFFSESTSSPSQTRVTSQLRANFKIIYFAQIYYFKLNLLLISFEAMSKSKTFGIKSEPESNPSPSQVRVKSGVNFNWSADLSNLMVFSLGPKCLKVSQSFMFYAYLLPSSFVLMHNNDNKKRNALKRTLHFSVVVFN